MEEISLGRSIEKFRKWRNPMIRKLKIICSTLLLLLGGLFVISNATPLSVIVGFVLAIASANYLVFITNGTYTAYLERLNTGLSGAIETIGNLFEAATNSIRIVSGSFGKEIYLQDRVFEALKNAKERGVSIEIVLGDPDVEMKYLEAGEENERLFLKWINRGEISVKKAADKRVKAHFIVVDDLHVRVEEKHPKRKPGGTIQKRRAKVYYLNPEIVQSYQKRFDKINQKTVPLTT